MKAICNNRILKYTGNGIFVVEDGEVVDYTTDNNNFVVNGYVLDSVTFFAHFKVTEGNQKMSYSDFEYILCNYVFRDAVLFPNEYSGVHYLIIQDGGGVTIMVTVNKEENIIRVSFEEKQEKYVSYEEALEGIRDYNM